MTVPAMVNSRLAMPTLNAIAVCEHPEGSETEEPGRAKRSPARLPDDREAQLVDDKTRTGGIDCKTSVDNMHSRL
jgi:hypothetical protein